MLRTTSSKVGQGSTTKSIKKTTSQVTLTSNTSVCSNSTSGCNMENYYNAKSQIQQSNDLVKEVPSLRSFACHVNDEGNKQLEKELKGKW
jgi:hypothetical protein